MPQIYNPGKDIIEAYLQGVESRRRIESDRARQAEFDARRKLEEKKHGEDTRRFNETYKRLTNEFSARQALDKAQHDLKKAQFSREIAKAYSAGEIEKPLDTSPEGIESFLQSGKLPEKNTVEVGGIPVDLSMAATPESVTARAAKKASELAIGTEKGRQSIIRPFKVEDALVRAREATLNRSWNTAERDKDRKSREEIARLNREARARAKTQAAADKKVTDTATIEADQAALLDQIFEGQILDTNPLTKKVPRHLMKERKAVPLQKSQFDAITSDSVVAEKAIISDVRKLAQAYNNYNLLEARTLRQQIEGAIGAFASPYGGKKLGILSRDDLKRLSELLPTMELGIRDKKANIKRAKAARDMFNGSSQQILSNLPIEQRVHLINKHDLFIPEEEE